MINIPCKDCILFAICNSKQNEIACSILYKYFVEDGVLAIDLPSFMYLCKPQPKRLKTIESVFNKKIRKWSLEIELPYYNIGEREVIISWEKY